MIQSIKKRLKNQKGLTLVELLAVVVILGIIAAIAVPSIGKIIENQKEEAAKANVQMVINAANLAKAAGEDPTAKWTDYIDGDIIDPWNKGSVSDSNITVTDSSGEIKVSITYTANGTDKVVEGTRNAITGP